MSKSTLITVAFYNLENLFDTIDDPNILDDDFTEKGSLKWTEQRYDNKVFKLSKAISQIGYETTRTLPAIVGLAEVENKKVLNDLVNHDGLKEGGYDYVHYNSPDERGIDTAMLYRKDCFEVLEAAPITVLVYNQEKIRDFTRDILYVRGKLYGEVVHFYVNHWPSRREGAQETDYKRIAAAQTVIKHVEKVKESDPDGTFIIMGDFNDDPASKSINEYLLMDEFYNPMLSMLMPDEVGSSTYKARWNLFDQILISTNLLASNKNALSFIRSEILSERFLEDWDKRYQGFPFRTYAGRKYLGGYSDHFPVYIILHN